MIATLIALAVLGQVGPHRADAAPTLPVGTRPEFQELAAQIGQQAGAGRWAAAQNLTKLFPQKTVRYQWADAKVPAASRPDYSGAASRSLDGWSRVTGVKFVAVTSKPDVVFRFENELAPRPDSTLPAGVALFFGNDPNRPRLEAIVGLKRGSPLQVSAPTDIASAVAYSVGAYLGLADLPFGLTCMVPWDVPVGSPTLPSVQEAALVRSISDYADYVKVLIAQKKAPSRATPKLALDPLELSADGAVQGDKVEFSIQLSNQGKAPLKFKIVPDCGCLSTGPSWGEVAPGRTQLVKAQVDTTEFPGEIKKRWLVATNDPERPYIVIPVYVQSEALYRFLSPAGTRQIVLPKATSPIEFFLTVSEKAPFELLKTKLEGLKGNFTVTEWKGELPDPAMGQGKQPRTGYKFRLNLEQDLPPGLNTIAVVASTTDSLFPTIRTNLTIQQGIVALPPLVFWGELGPTPRKTQAIVSRPGGPFSIRKVTVNSEHLQVSANLNFPSSEHKISISYNGKAPSGAFRATVTVETNDPDQPEIKIAVEATIQ
ncbi:MAG: DUF1573 domain-containing protein [Fimbriimonas sp.]